MKHRGITRRWFLNTFCVLAGVIVIIAIGADLMYAAYCYRYVEMSLNSRASDLVSSYFSSYIGGDEQTFVSGAISFVENFSDKNMMEVWVINKSGVPVVSSSGFAIDPKVEIPDYELAKDSETDKGKWYGKLSNGERVLAITTMLPAVKGEPSGAVRYICSLKYIRSQIAWVCVMTTLISAIIILFLLFSGLFFIRSIVRPVQRINETANRLATGDLSARVDTGGMRDELDDLCASFNNMASELNQSESLKNDFISTISHELRTPLTAIKGWGETLVQLGDSDPQTTAKGMSVIISESERLSKMVEELLDFSRMQSGKMQLYKEKIDVLAELDDAVFTMKDRTMREGLELIYNVPHLPLPMHGDAGRIHQVFVNLLDNAIKYNEHGGKVIILAKIQESSLIIYFTDTGCGIAPELIPRVTDKFFRANMSVRGTGIGLAVASEIVKLHGGTLEINSVVGEGTTVTVTLPVEPVEMAESLPERNQINEQQ